MTDPRNKAWLSSTQALSAALEAIQDIARQALSHEMEADLYADANFEDGYDILVGLARRALPQLQAALAEGEERGLLTVNPAPHAAAPYAPSGRVLTLSTADLVAAPPPVPIPDGWVLVPREPTEQMLAAGQISHIRADGFNHARDAWSVMLAAAPTLQGGGDE